MSISTVKNYEIPSVLRDFQSTIHEMGGRPCHCSCGTGYLTRPSVCCCSTGKSYFGQGNNG